MARNIEIKAQVQEPQRLEARVAAIADTGPEEIYQDDTFFNCESGRLKLRVFSDNTGELIYYRRADDGGPKESFYIRSATEHPDTLREALTLAYGESGRVKKRRLLYKVGRTRVHLDHVDELGHYMELEVVLESSESSDIGIEEANALMTSLGIRPNDLVQGAYVDLLSRKT